MYFNDEQSVTFLSRTRKQGLRSFEAESGISACAATHIIIASKDSNADNLIGIEWYSY